MRRIVGALRWTTVLVLVAVAGRVLWCAAGPAPDVGAQVRFVNDAADGGAGPQMQELFPEGDFFLHVLGGLAAPADDRLTTGERVEVMSRRLERLRTPEVMAPFAGCAVLDHGAFHTGWMLLLAVERARLSGDARHRQEVREHAGELRAALDAAPTGYLESYPGQTWPVDNVVAVAALVRADRLVGVPGTQDSVRTWLTRVEPSRDRATGLLPHRVDAEGTALDGPRATSQSLVQVFWPEIDPGTADDGWRRYVATFVDRRVGLVGVREHPHGTAGEGDVDSGPLVLGVSLSATVVTLAAARAHGDLRLADDLSREGELLGLPWQWDGRRRYAAGVLPVGDAFVAWARSVPAAPSAGDPPPAPRPLWGVLAGVPLGLALLVALTPFLSRRVGRSAARNVTLTGGGQG